ncbi:MAG TPA: Holliday junction resolvase RuvX [Candidatus Saccharimonadales bacterium]|jgi:putative Holliday junction resolvase|nr:Holliday junction resolvase RuvX [Candidatus Saccharimonadales bacterium]
MASPKANKTYLALDIGKQRIGVAIAHSDSRLPQPLSVILNTETIFEQLSQLIEQHDAVGLVVGVPRGLNHQETDQTRYTLDFIDLLEKNFAIPVYKQDEAVTSKQAEAELSSRGKPYSKADIDALAATYILDDFLHQLKIGPS